ncbi:hypothetical protein EDB85DRAFT_1918767 [Lactarius pseudohatsudake]|nr:hypothetical protein EDB85DRAFT_1918767 [Lactarius pseudohatsudake]
MPSTLFQPILSAAFADYAEETGIDPAERPFSDELQTCHRLDDTIKLLEDKANEFKDYQEGNRKSIDCLKPVVNVIHAFSGVLGEAISSVPIQPAKAIFVGVDVLLAAASGVSSSLLQCVRWLVRLRRKFPQRPSNPHQSPIDSIGVEISAKIMVELLSVLALATKQIKTGQVQIHEEAVRGERGRGCPAEVGPSHPGGKSDDYDPETRSGSLPYDDAKVVMNDGKAPMDGIWKALDTMQQIASVHKMRRSLFIDSVRCSMVVLN